MSNHLAIATITATLQRTLQSAIQADVDGARATTLSPSEMGGGTTETGVNIFLYNVVNNPGLQNMDAAPLRSRVNSARRQSALDLYYIFSFYGNNNELIPQRLLGSTVKILNDRRVLTPEMMREACDSPNLTFLQDSNLMDQLQQLSVMPMDLSLDELSKTWGVFFQTPYVLSIAYKVLVVFIEGEASFKRALPIRDRQPGNMTAPLLGRPVIEQIISAEGQFSPIVAGSEILIRGRYLKGNRLTQVRIGEIDITPPDISEKQITLPLVLIPSNALRAGVQPLKVIHSDNLNLPTDRTPTARLGSESNTIPFVLCPTIKKIDTETNPGHDDEPREGKLTLQSDLLIHPQQRVAIALNEWSTQNPAAYLFDVEPRTSETQEIMVEFKNVKPGEYLVRLIVDNAESQLDIDTNPDSPTFQWFISPKVLIS
jgi:hypothetical protein